MSKTSATSRKQKRSEQLTFLSPEPPASPSVPKENNLAWMTLVAGLHSDSAKSLASLVHDGSCGRTSPTSCVLTKDGRLEPSCGNWGNAGMGSPTAFLTLDTSESPRDGAVCLLSDIIETGSPPPQCSLTPHNLQRMRSRLTKYRGGNDPLLACLDGLETKPPSTDSNLSPLCEQSKGAKGSELQDVA